MHNGLQGALQRRCTGSGPGGDPKIIVQFDGSAHRESQVGGAGAALLQFDGNGLALLDWDARVLPKCADNIVAEANGADLAMHLYMRNTYACVMNRAFNPLPLSRIHGDIKQLLHDLDFRNRFRRSDLIPLINTFHRRRSRAAPNAITEYRPRETLSLTTLLAKPAHGSEITGMTSGVQGNLSVCQLTRPMNYYWKQTR